MHRADMSRCRSCGKPMLWKTTTNGRKIPLDPEPTPDGNIFLDDDGQTAVNVHRAGPPTDGRPLFKSHFATCEHADRHRRPQSPVHDRKGTA